MPFNVSADEAWRLTTTNLDVLLLTGAPLGKRRDGLLAVACCRDIWDLLTVPEFRAAIEAAEGHWDGRVTAHELVAAQRAASDSGWGSTCRERHRYAARRAVVAATAVNPIEAARWASLTRAIALTGAAVGPVTPPEYSPSLEAETQAATRHRQVGFFHDLAGGQYRRVKADAQRFSPEVKHLARTLYEAQDFAGLPVLADLLEEEGCVDAWLLHHLRGQGPAPVGEARCVTTLGELPAVFEWQDLGFPHVRGCWALDWVLRPSQ